MVVVDRLTKERHFVACKIDMSAEDLAILFVREIYRLHGLPDSMVSDRGPLFVSALWKAVCHRLGTQILLSTAYHPETDGQTENANAYLEQYLRHFVSYAQDDWAQWLPMAEFAANNVVNASTSMSPFFANKGFHPRMSFGPPRTVERTAAKALKEATSEGNTFAHKMEDIPRELHTNLITRGMHNKYQPLPTVNLHLRIELETRSFSPRRTSLLPGR